MSKLTPELLAAAVERRPRGESLEKIAVAVGVSRRTLSRALAQSVTPPAEGEQVEHPRVAAARAAYQDWLYIQELDLDIRAEAARTEIRALFGADPL